MIILDFLSSSDFWYTVLRSMTPVLFLTLGALIASASGILNLGLEGSMTVAALFGVLGSGYSGSLMVGLLCGLLGGTLVTMLLAFSVIRLGANRIIAGVALNLACSGGAIFLLYTLTGDKNSSNALPSLAFPSVNIPLLQDIPVLGTILSGHNLLTYLSLVMAVTVFVVLKYTKFGIKVRSVGEMPTAAESVGIKIKSVQYQALFFSGLLSSLGGIYLSMGYVSRFTTGMAAGRGYIALATNAMAGGNALMAVFSSVLYGFGSSIAVYMQSNKVDPYLVEIIPYLSIIIFYTVVSLIQSKRNSKAAISAARSALYRKNRSTN